MATIAALQTWKRTYADPEGEAARGAYESRQTQYRYYWQWYVNSVYEDMRTWSYYKAQYRLYRYTRSIYNPARRLVDFYAGAVYPGVLSEDAKRLPDGVQLAIPISADAPPELRAASAQFWQWSNWQSGKSLMVRYGAALGDCLVEVADELDRGKVTANIVWPGLVTDMLLDNTGNVKRYVLEYDIEDNGKLYTYRKEVDGEAVRTFRDGEPFSYNGNPPEYANPYGFVPAVWVRHINLGGDHGAPAMRNLGKWDELNSLAAHTHDQLHKVMSAPVLISATGSVGKLFDQDKRGQTQDKTGGGDSETINILKGPEGATVSTLPLETKDALMYMQELIGEIEADHPELSMYNELRKMSQVTGPAATRLMGDVSALVVDAQATYDHQSIKLFQMAVAIAGWRANSGAWGRQLTDQQRKFLPFDLTSYQAGGLNFDIDPRPLIAPTRGEGAVDRATVFATLVNGGADLYSAAIVAGYSEQEAQMLLQGDRPDGVTQ